MAGMVSGQRPPAPQPLGLVQDFLNTTWLRTGEDAWPDADGLRRWLTERGLLTAAAPVTAAHLRRARRLRQVLRASLGGQSTDAAALSDFLVYPVATPAGWRLEPAADDGVVAALARIVIHTVTPHPGSEWSRLKVCAAADCRWVFYDPSRNRSATWCNMNVCGSRAKSRTYYHRHQAARGRADP